MLNANANEKIGVNIDGIYGIAEMVASHDGAIEELATLAAEMEVK